MFLLWFDDTPRRAPAEKIAAAIDAYQRRFGRAPNVVLTNDADRVEVMGMTVRSEGYIRRNNFWIGFEA